MDTKERKILEDLLATFDKYENDCFDKIHFLSEHNFNFEKQVIDIKRSAYHDCFRELRQALSKIDNMTH